MVFDTAKTGTGTASVEGNNRWFCDAPNQTKLHQFQSLGSHPEALDQVAGHGKEG